MGKKTQSGPFSCCLLSQYRATDFVVPGAGRLELKFTPSNGGKPMEFNVFDFKESGGVALGMYNTDAVSWLVACLLA